MSVYNLTQIQIFCWPLYVNEQHQTLGGIQSPAGSEA